MKGSRAVQCNTCKQKFPNIVSLGLHMTEHAVNKGRCPHCCTQLSSLNDKVQDQYFLHLPTCTKLPKIFSSEINSFAGMLPQVNTPSQELSYCNSEVGNQSDSSVNFYKEKIMGFSSPYRETLSEKWSDVFATSYNPACRVVQSRNSVDKSNAINISTNKKVRVEKSKRIFSNNSSSKNGSFVNKTRLSLSSGTSQTHKIPKSNRTPQGSMGKNLTHKTKLNESTENGNNTFVKNNSELPCPGCSKKFENDNELDNHMIKVHVNKSEIHSNAGNYCSDSFLSRKKLFEHKQVNKCKKCGTVFTSKNIKDLCLNCGNHNRKSASQQSYYNLNKKVGNSVIRNSSVTFNKTVVNKKLNGTPLDKKLNGTPLDKKLNGTPLDNNLFFSNNDRIGVVKQNKELRCVSCCGLFKDFKGVSEHANLCEISDSYEVVNDEDIIWVCRICSNDFESVFEYDIHKKTCNRMPQRKKCKNANPHVSKSGKISRRKSTVLPCGHKFNSKMERKMHVCNDYIEFMTSCKVILTKDPHPQNESTSVLAYSRKNKYILHSKKCEYAKRNETSHTSEISDPVPTTSNSQLSKSTCETNASANYSMRNGTQSNKDTDKSVSSWKCICKCCDTRFLSKKDYEWHVKNQLSSTSSFCSQCMTSFETPASFRLHSCKEALSTATVFPMVAEGRTACPSVLADSNAESPPSFFNDVKPILDCVIPQQTNDDVAREGATNAPSGSCVNVAAAASIKASTSIQCSSFSSPRSRVPFTKNHEKCSMCQQSLASETPCHEYQVPSVGLHCAHQTHNCQQNRVTLVTSDSNHNQEFTNSGSSHVDNHLLASQYPDINMAQTQNLVLCQSDHSASGNVCLQHQSSNNTFHTRQFCGSSKSSVDPPKPINHKLLCSQKVIYQHVYPDSYLPNSLYPYQTNYSILNSQSPFVQASFPIPNNSAVRMYNNLCRVDSNVSCSSLRSESSESCSSVTGVHSGGPVISHFGTVAGHSDESNKQQTTPKRNVQVVFTENRSSCNAYVVVKKTGDNNQSVDRYICKQCIMSFPMAESIADHLENSHEIPIGSELNVTGILL